MSYPIENTTIALQSFAHPVYQTKIWDERGIFYSVQTCQQLLNTACLRTGASYRGKRDAISSLLHFKQNVPIPICFKQNICAIPSISPQRWECIWYFYAHVKDIRKQGKQTLLTFHNGDTLLIDCSYYRTQQQLLRAGRILSHFQLLKV
ncbi:competence protein ComK [Ectobacillus panaciterrae]|uniref:competence protein ComK n=1 Tax=Ectobacillus panaciterrae TaxID=363872 RepID=UPI00040C7616|nr:competence protein ComK [Ectobacillus panaciterrae]